MRIASAQINSTLGDFQANAEKVLDFVNRALERRCDLVVFPELSLFGYWPADLLERKSNIEAQLKALNWLQKKIPEGIFVLVGAVTKNNSKFGKLYFNSAVLLRKAKKPVEFHKELLPNYDVFDEMRFFEKGDLSKNSFVLKGKRVLVTICEDIWASGQAWVGTRYTKNPIDSLKGKKFDLAVNLSASPFSIDKVKRRKSVATYLAKKIKGPVIYTNMVGAQDEIIFDGGSFAVDQSGKPLMQSSFFEEDLNVIDFDEKKAGHRKNITEIEKLRQSLVLGIRDFASKNGIQRLHLGLSGGIDSALVACLAVDAIGPGRVSLIYMPGPHSSDLSGSLAVELSKNLGCKLTQFDINPSYQTTLNSIEKDFGHSGFGLVNENLQSRLRAVFLMAFSNQNNSMLLNTSNKSEMAVGYSTLYGDQCGGLAPIGDLLKTQVFQLSRHYNSDHEVIPNAIIEREPTAELAPNQKDQDSLPEYSVLDKAIQKIVVECRAPSTSTDKWLIEKLRQSEFKRWQAPPVLRVSQHAFGRGRRFPITNKSAF
ncbi:MAG: NAD+ synthase [Bdellovibrionales bacterium]|nr:NAD+ synthase [Bdellovibrionales bacterium]